MSGRVSKSIKNAEVNLVFYFLTLFLSFFSRKVFLDCLGPEFIGLSGTLSNILGYLNLAELGIASCISFHLYKPLQENNHEKLQELLSAYGYLYQCVGLIILIVGLILSIFFPWIFGSTTLSLSIVYFAFYSLLGSSLIGYFINYRQILLSADQKNYIVAIYTRSASLIKTLLQIYLAYNYKNLYLWVFVEFLFSLLACIILNWKINNEYPWLQTNKHKGRFLLKKYPGILTNTKQIFIHKIKDVILMRSDELFVFMFVSLKMVAYYGNYTLIVSRIGQVFSAILDSINAGIGNLIAEGNKEKIMQVFWEMLTIRHFVAGFLCFSTYHFVEPLISVWLGEQYILDRTITALLAVYIYISASRGVVDMYNHAHGLYADTWSAWTELAINIIITVIAGYLWGIIGILLGKIISTGIIIVLWKPYYLFHSGLRLKYSKYWEGSIRNYLVSFVSFIITHSIINYYFTLNVSGFGLLTCFCILCTIIYLLINLSLIFLFCKGARQSVFRIKNYLIKNRA
jgi:O-antigen/teichoic acid export membrane protein